VIKNKTATVQFSRGGRDGFSAMEEGEAVKLLGRR
jgi:hypothetical protein